MDGTQFDELTRSLNRSRRALVAGSFGLAASWLGVPGIEAKKKRKKKHKKKREKGKAESTCGNAGSKPVKGACCAGLVLVDGVCRRCDVCNSGCGFSAIQAAIDAADTGDIIAICPGAYKQDLSIVKDVRLVGAGDGDGSNTTIVQGSGDGLVVAMTSSSVTLEHLRITGGLSEGLGGGINNDDGTLKLIGCTVSGNGASFGGGIFNSGTLELIGCTISGNAASAGAGIYVSIDGTLTVDAASRITGNTASNTGGGIFNGGTVTLASSAIVSGNTPNNCKGTHAVANCNG